MASPRRARDEGRRRIMKTFLSLSMGRRKRRREAPERKKGRVTRQWERGRRRGGNLGGAGEGMKEEEKREEVRPAGESRKEGDAFRFRDEKVTGRSQQCQR
jgi:hypothetical protein